MCGYVFVFFFFFFQAEDGIRDSSVTGVQTCALPICDLERDRLGVRTAALDRYQRRDGFVKIGRASCRERSVDLGGRRIIKKKHTTAERLLPEEWSSQSCNSGPCSDAAT